MTNATILENKILFPFGNSFNLKLTAAVSSRHFGNMSLYYGNTEESLANRKDFLSSLGLDFKSLVCAKQIHQAYIKYVKDEDVGKGSLAYNASIADTDALITDKKDIPLAIFTADCLSIFLYDAKTPAIGLVHAGWRSSKENILSKVVELMRKEFNTDPADLLISFGPGIRSCCYQVGKEFSGLFPGYVTELRERFFLDLVTVNKKQLLAQGIKETNISDCRICTFCNNKEFFSYRREGELSGRVMSVMMLK